MPRGDKPHPLARTARLKATGGGEEGYLVGSGVFKPTDAAGNKLKKASNVPSGATIEEATALLESHNATFVRTVSMSASYYLCASYLSYFVSPDARDSQVAVQQATAAEESRPPFLIRLSSVKV